MPIRLPLLTATPSDTRRVPVLPIAGTGLTYRSGERVLLDRVDFALDARGAITAIVGPNGAGKSLLLRLLAGLLRPTEGSVTWGGRPVDRMRIRDIGFVLQRPILLNRSAIANVEYALAINGIGKSERRECARDALEQARLSHVAWSPARSLSGGEQQRLALTRALVLAPQCLMLDEPTANLDPVSTEYFENQLKAQRDAGTPILLVTQDVGQVRRLADRVLFLHLGRVVEDAEAQRFLEALDAGHAGAFFRSKLAI